VFNVLEDIVMRKQARAAFVVLIVGFMAGCIVSDELTTVTIQPDGSADIVKFRSNIRSSEKGGKGEAELQRYVEEFDLHKDSDYVQITQAGGQVAESRWIRKEVPYANVITASFSDAAGLEKFCTIEGKEGELRLVPQFSREGARCRFSITMIPPKDLKHQESSSPSCKEFRQKQANGVSETRFVVAGGQIIASQGFTVAGDKCSALFAPEEVEELLRTKRDQVELYLEWELVGN
jgi:hypothetical protein